MLCMSEMTTVETKFYSQPHSQNFVTRYIGLKTSVQFFAFKIGLTTQRIGLDPILFYNLPNRVDQLIQLSTQNFGLRFTFPGTMEAIITMVLFTKDKEVLPLSN